MSEHIAEPNIVVEPGKWFGEPRIEVRVTAQAQVKLWEDVTVEAELTHRMHHPIELTLVNVERSPLGKEFRRNVAKIELYGDDEAIAFRELIVWAFEELPKLRARCEPVEIAAGVFKDVLNTPESVALYGLASHEYSEAAEAATGNARDREEVCT